MSRFLFVVVSLASVGVAGYALVAYTLGPPGKTVHPEMAAAYETQRLGIYAHIFASCVTLLLGPMQFMDSLRYRMPRLHILGGKVYLFGVLIGGLAGLYMAFHAYGGIVATVGFAVLAVVWLLTGLWALLTIKRRRIVEHRNWMVRNFALAMAAVTLRAYLGIGAVAGVPFDTLYPILAWICWVPNLFVAEWIIRSMNRTGAGGGEPGVQTADHSAGLGAS
jgi:hypothetical protein